MKGTEIILMNTKKQILFSFSKKDFEVTWFSGEGAGGQHRNKHKNSCRIKHKETGLMASSQEHKSAPQNKKAAFRRLVKLLVAHYVPTEERDRPSIGDGYTRTYNEATNRVKDHLTGDTFSYNLTVGKGTLDDIIETRRKKV